MQARALLVVVLASSVIAAWPGCAASKVHDSSSMMDKEGLLSSSHKHAATAKRVLSPHSSSAGPRMSAAGFNPDTMSELDDVKTVFGAQAGEFIPRLQEDNPPSDPPAFDLDKAERMARLTSVAYCSDVSVITAWSCSRCQRVPNFLPYQVVFDEQWDLLAYAGYDAAQDAIVLSFRGTDSRSWGNWINNLKTWRQNKMYPIPEAPRAMVHAGFYNSWTQSSLQSNLTQLVQELLVKHKTPRLFITGHSMGAALGSLAALDLKFKLGFDEVRMWTFGSPRVGNYVWQEFFNQHVTESWRFTHNRDVVPSLPPRLIGFHHLAREAWTVDYEGPGGVIEQKILMCDGTGEDPSCHDSACMLGLCTSVADHLMYLGVEMYRDAMEC